MKSATNRRSSRTIVLSTGLILLGPLLASCGSTKTVTTRTAESSASGTNGTNENLVEISPGTWLIDRIEVDGTSFELEAKNFALKVAGTGTNTTFSFVLFDSSTECSIEGGEWFRNANQFYLRKLYLQNAVECGLTRPAWVSLIRPALTNGSLNWEAEGGQATLSSELANIRLTRKK
jgi:hypothetical protein